MYTCLELFLQQLFFMSQLTQAGQHVGQLIAQLHNLHLDSLEFSLNSCCLLTCQQG